VHELEHIPEQTDGDLAGLCELIVEQTMKPGSFRVTMQQSRRWIAVVVLSGFAALAACATYEPAPPPPPNPFDRAWSAALGAAQDEGVRIASEDRGSGIIRGFRDEQEVTINVRSQADGGARVEISARGPKGSDPGLAGRISRAYDRRMGR
jgi:hypothetical protein